MMNGEQQITFGTAKTPTEHKVQYEGRSDSAMQNMTDPLRVLFQVDKSIKIDISITTHSQIGALNAQLLK